MRLFTLTVQLAPSQAFRLRSWLQERLDDSRLSLQATADLVLAADEAFALALGRCRGRCEATVRVSVLDDDVYLTVSDNARDAPQAASDPFAITLLERLADQLQLEEDDRGRTVRVVKRSARARDAVA